MNLHGNYSLVLGGPIIGGYCDYVFFSLKSQASASASSFYVALFLYTVVDSSVVLMTPMPSSFTIMSQLSASPGRLYSFCSFHILFARESSLSLTIGSPKLIFSCKILSLIARICVSQRMLPDVALVPGVEGDAGTTVVATPVAFWPAWTGQPSCQCYGAGRRHSRTPITGGWSQNLLLNVTANHLI